MSGSIRLHPEFGVNPTIPQCYLCGEDKGEVALLGAAYKGQAPMHMCIDKEPCDNCKGYMKQGVIFVGVVDGANHDNPARTGRYCVIKDEAVQRMLKDSKEVLQKRAAFIEESIWKRLGLPV
jgi:hypothetical protein